VPGVISSRVGWKSYDSTLRACRWNCQETRSHSRRCSTRISG